MELQISQDWLDRKSQSPEEGAITVGAIMSLEELDTRASELFNQFIDQPSAMEIRRRGWLRTYTDSTRESTRNSILKAFSDFISDRPPTLAMHAMFRESHENAQINLWRGLTTQLWLAHCASTAIEENIPQFNPNGLSTESITELVRLSQFDDGPARARTWLRGIGIHLVANDPLPSMRLDGATLMLINERPLIALTLRFDRIDSFWFTLLHELGHIKRHLIGNYSLAFLDDLEESTLDAKEELEEEADAFARNSSIPRDIWRRSGARRMCTKPAILELANQLHIHPAIPAGRLRFEKRNYTLFPELLGYDQVRRYFID